jgi:hypothetical protein
VDVFGQHGRDIGGLKEDIAYPVKNKFPILALEKSKVELGLNLFKISKLIIFNTDRINSFFAVETFIHKAWSASTI